MKNMISCDAASSATVLSMGCLELLLRASVFTVLDCNEMGGAVMSREVYGASLSGLVSCGWCWGSASGCQWLLLKNPAPHPKPPSFHSES